ncbi:MAG: sigma-70 family RNA polymerase sigma factor, partial [Myxococcales bacterium]|nr:sigma-70 family RNA polymerase sigma factor [Myxococcales bacterium]
MNRGPQDEDDLPFARALAAGDTGAVHLFEGRYRPVVRHALTVAMRRWRPEVPVEPDDYVQDFVGFLFSDGGRRLGTFEGRSTFGSWLYTVALRYFQRAFARRVQDRRSDAVLTSLPDTRQRSAELQAIASHEAARLRAAVRDLPPDDQIFVRLFFVEGLNASEVARTLGKGASAVRMRKMRVLERLRAALEQ